MSDTFRNGLVAFAMAAAAVLVVSLVLVFATDGGGDSTVGGPASVTPAVLGESQTPRPVE